MRAGGHVAAASWKEGGDGDLVKADEKLSHLTRQALDALYNALPAHLIPRFQTRLHERRIVFPHHLLEIHQGGISIGYEYDVIASPRTSELMARRSHPPFGFIAPYCVAQLLPCNKSNTARVTMLLVNLQHHQGIRPSAETFSLLEDTGDIRTGFYDIQHKHP